MGFMDKELQCVECGTTFVFTADEQETFAARGYTNEPRRCLPCREARKARDYNSGGYNSYRPRRQMFPAVCTQCGKDTEVPFEPRNGRPVYCRECYNKVGTRRY
jgi:CxxC-x17-CxxC domain-containing protein